MQMTIENTAQTVKAVEAWAEWREKIRLSALARHLNLSRQAVQGWLIVPADRHVAVAHWLDIAPETLRPDLYT